MKGPNPPTPPHPPLDSLLNWTKQKGLPLVEGILRSTKKAHSCLAKYTLRPVRYPLDRQFGGFEPLLLVEGNRESVLTTRLEASRKYRLCWVNQTANKSLLELQACQINGREIQTSLRTFFLGSPLSCYPFLCVQKDILISHRPKRNIPVNFRKKSTNMEPVPQQSRASHSRRPFFVFPFCFHCCDAMDGVAECQQTGQCVYDLSAGETPVWGEFVAMYIVWPLLTRHASKGCPC